MSVDYNWLQVILSAIEGDLITTTTKIEKIIGELKSSEKIALFNFAELVDYTTNYIICCLQLGRLVEIVDAHNYILTLLPKVSFHIFNHGTVLAHFVYSLQYAYLQMGAVKGYKRAVQLEKQIRTLGNAYDLKLEVNMLSLIHI